MQQSLTSLAPSSYHLAMGIFTASSPNNPVVPIAKGVRAVFVLMFFIMAVYAISLLTRHVKSKDQIEFENWIETANIQLEHEKESKTLPSLSLRVIPDGSELAPKEMRITVSDAADSRAHVQRLLELVRESDLYSRSRKEGSTPRAGDLVFAITSEAKSFTLVVPYSAIRRDVKAGLLLKLIDEYSKIPAPGEQVKREDSSGSDEWNGTASDAEPLQGEVP